MTDAGTAKDPGWAATWIGAVDALRGQVEEHVALERAVHRLPLVAGSAAAAEIVKVAAEMVHRLDLDLESLLLQCAHDVAQFGRPVSLEFAAGAHRLEGEYRQLGVSATEATRSAREFAEVWRRSLEGNYRQHHRGQRLPGSRRTKRLRKKRLTKINRWFERSAW